MFLRQENKLDTLLLDQAFTKEAIQEIQHSLLKINEDRLTIQEFEVKWKIYKKLPFHKNDFDEFNKKLKNKASMCRDFVSHCF